MKRKREHRFGASVLGVLGFIILICVGLSFTIQSGYELYKVNRPDYVEIPGTVTSVAKNISSRVKFSKVTVSYEYNQRQYSKCWYVQSL